MDWTLRGCKKKDAILCDHLKLAKMKASKSSENESNPPTMTIVDA
jgi:hypothetical protein